MLRRMQIAIIIMFTAITLCVLSYFITRFITDDITKNIDEIEFFILAENNERAIESAEKLTQKWERQYKVLSSYISHEHLERSEVAINSIQNYLYVKDYSAALIVCEDIRVCSAHLLSSEVPSFWNIF